MKFDNQLCTLEQAEIFKALGVWQDNNYFVYIKLRNGKTCPCVEATIPREHKNQIVAAAFTVAELLKMLPFIILHDGHEYFMSFGHSMKGYRITYETQKLGLIFNIDEDLDREKKALFSTMRSGKLAAHVLGEYLRMLLQHGDGIVDIDKLNDRLKNS